METTSLSKFFGLYAVLEWGLRDIEFLGPHSFRVGKDGKKMTFYVHGQDHNNYSLDIPDSEEEYYIVFIPNKSGDNCVLLLGDDCRGKTMTFEELAPLIKRKWRIEQPQSTTTN